MPKISLVMPVYKTEKFLERAIESILDQDYKDWELICVLDGFSEKARDIIQSFDDKRISFRTIDHAGACAARNAGAESSDGEYISFFSSDFQANPGMLRTWMMNFEEHKDADFIYGGYLFPSRQAYPSEEFDARQLEAYNYIDGGFPLKRKLWEEHPWDEKLKSLNDWDFWLRIVKAGYKGHFLGNYYSYIAELPREGGLSYDSAQNWIERVKYIREKNGIKQREIVVASLGAPFFGKNVARMLDADYMPMPSFKPHTYKMVYLLGFYPNASADHARVFQNAPKDCKKVIHWLGSDIEGLTKLPWCNLKMLVKSLNETTTKQFCESKSKEEELKDMRIDCEVLPVLRDLKNFKIRETFPKEFAVAVYLPGVNMPTYMPILIDNVTKNMPDVKFYFYGDKCVKKTQVTKNIHIIGWKDIDEVIDKCAVLLRMTRHDGLPTAPMEFIMSGRYVITNTDMPYVEHIGCNEDIEGLRKEVIERIREVRKWVKEGKKPSMAGAEYYKNYLNPEPIKKRIYEIIANGRVKKTKSK